MFLLENESEPAQLIPKYISKAAKAQSSGLFSGTAAQTFHFLTFSICFLCTCHTTYRNSTYGELNRYNLRLY